MQSSTQIITTNKPTPSLFIGRMPFLSPNQQCQSTEGENITFHGLTYPKLTCGSSNFSLWPLIAPGYLGEVCHASVLRCQYPIMTTTTTNKYTHVLRCHFKCHFPGKPGWSGCSPLVVLTRGLGVKFNGWILFLAPTSRNTLLGFIFSASVVKGKGITTLCVGSLKPVPQLLLTDIVH